MGTNYYYIKSEKLAEVLLGDHCPTCGQEVCARELGTHIGKSSVGWAFALRVHPELGLTSLDEWIEAWKTPGSAIQDEYGTVVSPEDMLDRITKRSHPTGLRRHTPEVTGWFPSVAVIVPGETYDLCNYEFS